MNERKSKIFGLLSPQNNHYHIFTSIYSISINKIDSSCAIMFCKPFFAFIQHDILCILLNIHLHHNFLMPGYILNLPYLIQYLVVNQICSSTNRTEKGKSCKCLIRKTNNSTEKCFNKNTFVHSIPYKSALWSRCQMFLFYCDFYHDSKVNILLSDVSLHAEEQERNLTRKHEAQEFNFASIL